MDFLVKKFRAEAVRRITNEPISSEHLDKMAKHPPKQFLGLFYICRTWNLNVSGGNDELHKIH